MLFKKYHPAIGSRPGTLVIPEEAPEPRIKVINYGRNHFVEKQVEDVDELTDALGSEYFSWIDVQGFGNKTVIEKISAIFGFHPLLIEDIVNMPQRPKSESYDEQLLIIVRMVVPERPEEIDLEQVSLVIGKNYVITFQERYGDVFDPVRERLRRKNGPITENGVVYLGYALVDTIVDAYFPVLEMIGSHLESLENAVIADPSPALLSELNQWKSRLINLRRVIWPHREAINSIVRGDHPMITENVKYFFRDTFDHCVQSSEVVEMYREMVTSLMNTYLTSIANRTNEVMRVLTIVSTIFIPITFIAGIYGMNFDHMPELHMKWSYLFVWVAILSVAGTMLSLFWYKGWIGNRRRAFKNRSSD